MGLIRRSRCRLLWNVKVTDIIHSSRGLRKGDPLSLYLLVMCIEQLGYWIQGKVAEGSWRPLRASRGGNRVSHLDDLMIFVEAADDQVDRIKEGLWVFCKVSC